MVEISVVCYSTIAADGSIAGFQCRLMLQILKGVLSGHANCALIASICPF